MVILYILMMGMKRNEAKELEAVDDRRMCLLTRGGNYIYS